MEYTVSIEDGRPIITMKISPEQARLLAVGARMRRDDASAEIEEERDWPELQSAIDTLRVKYDSLDTFLMGAQQQADQLFRDAMPRIDP